MSDTQHAYEIAAQARRYAMLAERPELLYPDAAVRAERLVLDDARAPLDVILLAGVGELDRLCAAAVSALSRDAPQAKPILDLLGVLPADYLLSIYFALSADRRGQCESDPVWAYHLRRVPDGVGEAIECLTSLALGDMSDTPEQILDADEAAEFREFSQDLLRRALGMPHELSETDEALAVAGEQVVAELMPNGG